MGTRPAFSNRRGCRVPATVDGQGLETMGWRRRKRTAWATGLSLVLHVLMLTGMVVGLKVTLPPPEERDMEVSLVPPLVRPVIPPTRPPSTPSAPARQAPPAVQALRPHIAPLPPASAPTTSLPEVKAPPEQKPQVYGPVVSDDGMRPSVSGRMGCDDPLGIRLTESQKQVCANNLTERTKAAKALELNIQEANKAAFDRNRRCRDVYTRQGIPGSAQAGSGGSIPGLGNVPSFKDCPAADR